MLNLYKETVMCYIIKTVNQYPGRDRDQDDDIRKSD